MFARRILVATDFSIRSRAALRYAVELARALSAEIDVLHVIAPPSRVALAADAYLDRPLPRVPEERLAKARTELGQFTSLVSHQDVNTNRLIEEGDPAATIVRIANERSAALVVIGTHARTGITEMLLGSVAHQVITCAPCPVVTLRGDELGQVR
jgi:nucleotide-binding universal stress UspA family protein